VGFFLPKFNFRKLIDFTKTSCCFWRPNHRPNSDSSNYRIQTE